ncbi:L-serine ammonia-lyase, iron-sulfur-dependent, subunit alpha [Salibacterium sp. K-3]
MRFQSIEELVTLGEQENKSIAELMIEEQSTETGRSTTEEFSQMKDLYVVMKDAVHKGLTEDTTSKNGLTGKDAQRVMHYTAFHDPVAGEHSARAMTYALAVSEINASMGKIVATPTAGSCGVIPGVFVSAQERHQWPDDKMVNGLFCAGALGYVMANNSFVSGAEGGCQAEIGSAVGMASGAIAELNGASPREVSHAVGMSLKNMLGLVCDPVAGLVEVPCIVRNGFGAVTALTAADMARAGMKSVIPADEVIKTMFDIGNAMSSDYKETARGGLAQTPTGKAMMESIFGKR